MKSINRELGFGSQSVVYKEVLEHNSAKIRLEIKSDSYQNQCYAKASLWNGSEWKFLDSIHSSNMSTPKGLIYWPKHNEATKDTFAQDRKTLLKLVKDVL